MPSKEGEEPKGTETGSRPAARTAASYGPDARELR